MFLLTTNLGRFFYLKINESQYIALFVVSRSIKKLFSIACVNIYFSQSIVNYPFSIDLKVWVYPTSQSAISCSKLTIETLEQGVKYVQS